MARWVVLIEAVPRGGGGEMSRDDLQLLLEAVAEVSPVGLHADDRYGVQMTLDAEDAVSAVALAVGRWRNAVAALGLPPATLVRSEAMTEGELATEIDAELGHRRHPMSNETGAQLARRIAQLADADAVRAAHRATRALLRAQTATEAIGILIEFVEQLGATVVATPAEADAMPIDLCLGEGVPVYPAADPCSVARLRLEELLPTVVEDARQAVSLLRGA